jgi:hypothetical protein
VLATILIEIFVAPFATDWVAGVIDIDALLATTGLTVVNKEQIKTPAISEPTIVPFFLCDILSFLVLKLIGSI